MANRYTTSKENAEKAAATMTSRRSGLPAAAGTGRTVTRYIVDKYADSDGAERDANGRFGWGIVERWTYNDRPDLPEFGGGFTVLDKSMFE